MPGADGPPVSTLPASLLHHHLPHVPPGRGAQASGCLSLPSPLGRRGASPCLLSPTSTDEDPIGRVIGHPVATGLQVHFSTMGSSRGVELRDRSV